MHQATLSNENCAQGRFGLEPTPQQLCTAGEGAPEPGPPRVTSALRPCPSSEGYGAGLEAKAELSSPD